MMKQRWSIRTGSIIKKKSGDVIINFSDLVSQFQFMFLGEKKHWKLQEAEELWLHPVTELKPQPDTQPDHVIVPPLRRRDA